MGQFVVSFSGSLAFVPHTTGRAVRVLLPLDLHGWLTTDNTIVPPHRGFMRFKMSSLASDSPRKPDFVHQGKDGQYGICFLENESLTLPGSDGFSIDDTPIENKEEPTDRDRHSVRWIANVSEFCREARLNTAHLATTLPIGIAAIVDIVAGHMQTTEVSKEVFWLKPPSDIGDYRQRLAEEVSVSSGVDAGRCVIGSEGKPTLLLQEIDGKTDLKIFNEVLDDIILPEEYRRPKGSVDYDFDLVYELTDLVNTRSSHRHLPERGLPAHGTTGCKPGMFAPQAF